MSISNIPMNNTIMRSITITEINLGHQSMAGYCTLSASKDGVVVFDRPLLVDEDLGLTHEAYYRALAALAQKGSSPCCARTRNSGLRNDGATEARHGVVDIVSLNMLHLARIKSRPSFGRGPAGMPDRGASAVPAGGFATRSRAASGISLPALRPAREVQSLDWDR